MTDWIKFADKLPSEGVPVLGGWSQPWARGRVEIVHIADVGSVCGDKSRRGEKALYYQNYNGSYGDPSDLARGNGPTHWMPLPKPPVD